MLSVFTHIETIYLKIRAHSLPKNERRPLPVAVRRSKTPLLKLPNVTISHTCMDFRGARSGCRHRDQGRNFLFFIFARFGRFSCFGSFGGFVSVVSVVSLVSVVSFRPFRFVVSGFLVHAGKMPVDLEAWSLRSTAVGRSRRVEDFPAVDEEQLGSSGEHPLNLLH